MTRSEAGAFFIEYNSDAGGRQCETHWFCIPLDAVVSNIITREESNEDHAVRRVGGWTTKLLRD